MEPQNQEPADKKSKLGRADRYLTGLLRHFLLRYSYLIILTAAFVFLFYSWFTTQARYAELQAYIFEGSFSLKRGQALMKFDRDSGANRPLFSTSAGVNLIEFSDWSSEITVDGETRALWDTRQGYSLDSANARFYHSMQFGDWTLFKEVTLGPAPNRVLVEYYYRNDRRLSNVILRIAHFHYYFQSLQLTPGGFQSIVTKDNLSQQKQTQASSFYRINFKTRGSEITGPANPTPFEVREGSRNQYGLISFFSQYTSNDIAANTRTLLASEEFNWEELTPTVAPSPTR